jgi:hypothetical protein
MSCNFAANAQLFRAYSSLNAFVFGVCADNRLYRVFVLKLSQNARESKSLLKKTGLA